METDPEVRVVRGRDRGAVSAIRVYYTTGEVICSDDLDDLGVCPPGAWILVPSGTIVDPPVGGSIDIPVDATAIEIQTDFTDNMLQPNSVLGLDLTTTTPAQSPTVGPDTITWNTVAAAAQTDDGGAKGLSPNSEGNKVGVALATGPLEIKKVVDGPAAELRPTASTSPCSAPRSARTSTWATGPTSRSSRESSPDGRHPVGVGINGQRGHGRRGNPDFSATHSDDIPSGPDRSGGDRHQRLSGRIAGDGEEGGQARPWTPTGSPITYSPFTFDVSCTYLGEPVYTGAFQVPTAR